MQQFNLMITFHNYKVKTIQFQIKRKSLITITIFVPSDLQQNTNAEKTYSASVIKYRENLRLDALMPCRNLELEVMKININEL